MESSSENVIISTDQISVKVSDVSTCVPVEERASTPSQDKNSVAIHQKHFLNLDASTSTRIRRRSAPSLTSIQESPIEANYFKKPLLFCSDINRPQTLTTGKNFLARPVNIGIRRGSCPAILEPIKEGLFCELDRQATTRTGSLSPNLTLRRRRKSSTESPTVGEGLLVLDHRLRSNTSPVSIETKTSIALETLFPRPRRNSLGCATLDELKGQYKLLDSRSKVQEEEANVDSSFPLGFNVLEVS